MSATSAVLPLAPRGALDTLAQVMDERGARVRAALEDEVHAFGLPRLPLLPAPILVDARHRAAIARAAEFLARTLKRALDERLARGDDDKRVTARHLAIPRGLDALIAQEDPATRAQVLRFDGVFDEARGRLVFVEVQAGDPSAAGFSDLALTCFVAHGLASRLDATPDFLLDAHRDVVRTRSGSASPRVVHVVADQGLVRADHACMVALARRAGLDAHLVAPDALRLEAGRIGHALGPIDVLVRDTHEELVGPQAAPGADAVVRACLGGLPRVNAFADALLDDKGSFALLFDATYRTSLDEETRRIVDECVAPTTLAHHDARARALEEPGSSVLKPREGYGGFGVIIGRDDEDTLRRAVLRATPARHVLQRAIDGTPHPVFVDEGAHVTRASRHLALSAWVIGGRFAGCYARAGITRVVNVHQGGGVAPVLFV